MANNCNIIHHHEFMCCLETVWVDLHSLSTSAAAKVYSTTCKHEDTTVSIDSAHLLFPG